MAICLEDLKSYQNAIRTKEENDEAPPPVLFMGQYRLRLIPISELPIVSNYSNFTQLGLNSDEVLVIDSSIESEKKETFSKVKKSAKIQAEQSDSMEVGGDEEEEADKENDTSATGPLVTSFLTLDKLQKDSGKGIDMEIGDFEFEMPSFDANPIPPEDGISLLRYLRLSSPNHFSDAVAKLPIWISTSSDSFPSTCWLSSGRTQKNVQFSGVTHVLGFFNEHSEKLVNQLNETCGGAQVNRYRAIYDGIRRIVTENQKTPGEVIVDMRWNTKNSLVLLEQPVNAAECTIKIDLGWKDKRFFVDETIFEQLFFVLNLADVLANPEKEVVFPSEWEKFDDLVKQMNELIEACSNEDNVFASNDSSEEVTDKVWNIVRRCGDVKQATLLFKNFMQALTYGKIKSHVLENNKSYLAALIRSSKTCDFRMPILERLSTIEMMMEIGVESLRSRIIHEFETILKFPADELSLILKTCETDLINGEGSMNASVISLLPIAMSLATVNQIFGLLNEKDHVILPDLARRVLTKYTNSMVEKSKRGETESHYTFETTLPLLRINKEKFMNKRPRVWTCENSKTVGANVQCRMMTVLELESSLEHVTRVVNAIRPLREENSLDINSDYTVSHTVFSYLPKM